MTTSTCLPTEIVHDVVDHLADDPAALHSCALVSRLLLASARRHLFRTIYISDALQCAAFDRALRSTPSLGSLVRDLTLSDAGWLDVALPDSALGPNLSNVRSLALLHVDWTALGEPAAGALATHFTSPGVRALQLQHPVLRDWGDLVRLLAPRPAVQTLTLGRVRLRGPARAPDGSGRGVGRGVRELSTAGPSLHKTVGALLEWLPDLRPRTLRIQTIEDTHVPDVAVLLHALGPSLETFEMCTWAFHAPAWEDALAPHGQLLRHNTRLRTLSLISLYVYPGTPPLLAQLPLVLAQVAGDALEELSVELFFTDDSAVLLDLAAVGWPAVRAALAGPPFAGLRKLRVAFEYQSRRVRAVATAEVERKIRELLPEAEKRGILVIERTRNRFQ